MSDHSAASSSYSNANTFTSTSDHPLSPSPHESLIIDRLLATEPHQLPQPDYLLRCRDHSIDTTARHDSINWILKVRTHYHFRPVTAILSVNYFDRFLSAVSLPANGWAFQLLSVACLSLAAKMEEPYVPLLIDLQVFVPRFVFEPQTVQRMELWVMSNLNWRLRSITPFDYLHYFISKLPVADPSRLDPATQLLSTSSNLILNTTRVIDFLAFSPSIIAAAAVISAAGEGVDIPESYYEKVNKEMVRSCHQLMKEYLIDTCPSTDHKHIIVEEPPPPPSSPVGVLDAAACVSCGTRSGNALAASSLGRGSSSGNGQAEPSNKRPRSSTSDVQEQQP